MGCSTDPVCFWNVVPSAECKGLKGNDLCCVVPELSSPWLLDTPPDMVFAHGPAEWLRSGAATPPLPLAQHSSHSSRMILRYRAGHSVTDFSAEPERLPGAGKRALVVDDDMFARDALHLGLEALGVKVVSVSSGLEALHACGISPSAGSPPSSPRPRPFDAVFLDFHLLDANGAEVERSQPTAMSDDMCSGCTPN